ncbi:hypothetical protein SAMN05216464_11885 [Mucilaginibacter pineti]|uniref:Uncharacterized protein n=1 Tax=Mucilaginibacter pineti TaxID=1391627 RepID=A0A1G7L9T5_9SPHI|nr:hypothetical protein [Mucilaginibacter pineti]SDF46074.1 hypothetical protein SAMN05216464_11885 [Mucilaginibacter pineti]
MKKLILTLALAVGALTFSHAENGIKHSNPSHNTKKKNLVECSLTVTCADGTTVSATASSCAKAGAMCDAGCA